MGDVPAAGVALAPIGPWISVSGACSRSGKTALAERLIELQPELAAVKFTTTDEVFDGCPRNSPCSVCDIDAPYRIVTSGDVLEVSGTDTARMRRAGAPRVIWAIAKRRFARRAWRAVWEEIGGPAVVEGSTIAVRETPSLSFFVVHPQVDPDRWKPTSAPLVARADAVIVNQREGDPRPPSRQVLRALSSLGCDVPFVADLRRPLRSWAPALAARCASFAVPVAG
jgi:hypothetical protein